MAQVPRGTLHTTSTACGNCTLGGISVSSTLGIETETGGLTYERALQVRLLASDCL